MAYFNTNDMQQPLKDGTVVNTALSDYEKKLFQKVIQEKAEEAAKALPVNDGHVPLSDIFIVFK